MPVNIQPPFYPIIYVRGYAATMNEIEDTVATPYMGFNLGSTKVRLDHKARPIKFIFESPLIRLMKDCGYRDSYVGGDLPDPPPDGKLVPPRSIWIFRYYEQVSEELGSGDRCTVPEFAADLRAFILRVRDSVCGKDVKARKAFKVNLVAHSMGGLICRCYLQNTCRKGVGDPKRQAALELSNRGGDPLVHKVFTYGTPHNGIDVRGVNVPDLGPLDSVHVRNFNREEMAKYLRLSPSAKRSGRVSSLDGAFDPQRFFCFIGTNYHDYEAFFGLARKGTGPMSDGLVMCENAYVDGAARAYAHRSHSGHYGIVNSEVGYQNLRRFLFGRVRVDVLLKIDEIRLPKPIKELLLKGKKIRASYQIESTAKVRGGNVSLHERRVEHESAMFRSFADLIETPDKLPIYLFSGFLDPKAKPRRPSDTALAFAVRVAVKVPVYEVDNKFWFDDHFEGEDIFGETFVFHVRFAADGVRIKYGLASQDQFGVADREPHAIEQMEDGLRVVIPVGFEKGAKKRSAGKLRGSLVLIAR